MAPVQEGLRIAVFWVGWPGMMAVSAFVLLRTIHFYNQVNRQPVGRLVLLMVVGWVMTVASLAGIGTLFLHDNAEAARWVLPFFVVWAGSMVLIVTLVHRWGSEAVNINLYYMELATMDRVKTQFINTVAHELNTPLTPVRIRLSMMESGSLGPLTERQSAAIQTIMRNLDRLGVVIDQVVLCTQVQSGNLRLEPAAVELDKAVATVASRFAAQAEARGVALAAETHSGVTLQADANRFEWMLAALLTNAIKFTPSGGRVAVRTRAAPDGAVIEVADTGIGIATDARAHLFQPFRQAHDPMAVTEAGAGLGLYIAQGIASLHGGRIEAESAGAGKGSTFRVHLPLRFVGVTAATPAPPTLRAAP